VRTTHSPGDALFAEPQWALVGPHQIDRAMTKGSALALIKRRAEPEDQTAPAILEFQWPSTAVVNAPIPRSARNITWLIASMFVAMIVLLALIPIDQVVATRGIVVSQSRNILVQPLETSIVRSIEVHEGQEVKSGELLARLDPTFTSADVAALTSQLSSLEAQVARLRGEAENKPFTYSGIEPDWLLQLAIYGHRRAEFKSKVDNYAHRLDELSAAISRSQSDATGYRERLVVAQNIEHMRAELESNQAGSRLNLLQATDVRAEMARSLANAQQTGQAAKLEQDALAAERDAFVRGWQAEVSQQLAESEGKLSDARELLRKAKLRRQLVELRSEQDAIVQSVAKVSVGSVLQSGQQLITLVPADAPLEIEANISGRESGYVHLRDHVVIKFDTFPYSQYGVAEGSVRIISPSSFNPQEETRNPTSAVPGAQNTSEPFYRARISIDRVALHDVPEDFHVIPGMPVGADVKVGKRTVLRYLLGLMLPVAKEGMREP
jgi:hemolysin D